MSSLWPPRVALGRKFYQAKTFVPQNNETERNHRFLEAVPKDSIFTTRIYFENTRPSEMGLLIRALGIGFLEGGPNNPKYLVPVKIGGAKPRCLGAVRFAIEGIRLLQTSKGDFLGTTINGVKAYSVMREWLMDDSLLDEVAWLRFIDCAKPMLDPCPKELY